MNAMKPKCLVVARNERQGRKSKRIVHDFKIVVGPHYIAGTQQGYANRRDLRQAMRQTVRALIEFLFIEDSIHVRSTK